MLGRVAPLGALASAGDLLAGGALIVVGALALRRTGGAAPVHARGDGALTIGLVHGLAGGAALLMMLPALAAGAWGLTLAYLAGFSLGSTAAMTALAHGLACTTAAPRVMRHLDRIARGAGWASIAVGAAWIVI